MSITLQMSTASCCQKRHFRKIPSFSVKKSSNVRFFCESLQNIDKNTLYVQINRTLPPFCAANGTFCLYSYNSRGIQLTKRFMGRKTIRRGFLGSLRTVVVILMVILIVILMAILVVILMVFLMVIRCRFFGMTLL